jgi:hypothetical protein
MCSDSQRWPQTDRVWRQFDLFDLVMDRTQVDPIRAARRETGKAMAQARNVCLGCLWQKRCRALLEHGEADAVMGFCPNAGFFAQFRPHESCRHGKSKRTG